jgi:hypothetical protein
MPLQIFFCMDVLIYFIYVSRSHSNLKLELGSNEFDFIKYLKFKRFFLLSYMVVGRNPAAPQIWPSLAILFPSCAWPSCWPSFLLAWPSVCLPHPVANTQNQRTRETPNQNLHQIRSNRNSRSNPACTWVRGQRPHEISIKTPIKGAATDRYFVHQGQNPSFHSCVSCRRSMEFWTTSTPRQALGCHAANIGPRNRTSQPSKQAHGIAEVRPNCITIASPRRHSRLAKTGFSRVPGHVGSNASWFGAP